MKKLTSYSKRVKYTYVKTTLVTIFVSLFFLKGYTAFEKTGENYFHVFLNGYYDTFKPRGTGYLVGWMIFACVLLLAIFGIANYKKKDA